MANTNTPFGFSQYAGTGASPTYEQTQLAIASTNATAIFTGDPVVQLPTGYIAQAAAPQVITITGASGTGSLATLTFTALPAAPQVGTTAVVTGMTSTGSGYNGNYVITASTTTSITYASGWTGTFVGGGTATLYSPVAGIFVGCRYTSVAQKKPVWSNYWPGSDANGDVTAYVITDPNAQFVVQTANSSTTATAVGFANVGNNIGYAIGTGTVANGLSGAYADQASITSGAANPLLPFRILALANYTPGQISPLQSINGNDYTSAYNRIVVGFNNSMPRAFVGI